MSLKAKVEAIIYATEEPVTLNELATLLKDTVLANLEAEEAARLALNETVSDGPREVESEEDDASPMDEAAIDAPTESVESEGTPNSTPEIQPDEPPIPASKKEDKQAQDKEQLKAVKACLNRIIEELIADYASNERGMEIRQIAGGYRMATKPEHHDVVVSFAKSLKPPVRVSLQALETLAVIAYRQPVTVPEISEIRGVDSAGVIATLLDRKLVTTAGRKQVIGRPILYKTTKEFLMRFGLKDLAELPSVEEFEKLGDPQADLFTAPAQAAPANGGDGEEAVTEAVPEPGSHLMGESDIPADGNYVTEADAAPDSAPEESAKPDEAAGDSDAEPWPVTEAVPEVSHHNLAGESAMPADGSFATEAEPETQPEDSRKKS